MKKPAPLSAGFFLRSIRDFFTPSTASVSPIVPVIVIAQIAVAVENTATSQSKAIVTTAAPTALYAVVEALVLAGPTLLLHRLAAFAAEAPPATSHIGSLGVEYFPASTPLTLTLYHIHSLLFAAISIGEAQRLAPTGLSQNRCLSRSFFNK
jgi:hypothetical protein